MSQKIRTRFAPSPTGYLHVGGARTALLSYLYARHFGGQFILRIEDTDQARSTEASIHAILESMEWLGLEYDEGPFYQSKRFDRYQEVAHQLLANGHAYRCYCSKERLATLREQQMANKQKPRYDGHCRELKNPPNNQPYVVRFRNPPTGCVTFTDLIRGEITVENSELDDLVLTRMDRVPTYNFTVVVDDWDMHITHVVRGDDHINNTPRQINILQALNAELPQYAHVPMILGPDGKRLSKRHGAVSVMQYRDEGFLPEALLNYLVRLGWSHGDQEMFSKKEMIQLFNLEHVHRAAASFSQDKLLWLNQQYLKTIVPEQLVKPLTLLMKDVDVTQGPALTEVITVQNERCKTLVEMAEKSRYFYVDFDAYDEKATKKFLTLESLPGLQALHQAFSECQTWQREPLHHLIFNTAEKLNLKLGKLAQPLRVAITGGTVSPPMDVTLELIGRERVLKRLAKAVALID